MISEEKLGHIDLKEETGTELGELGPGHTSLNPASSRFQFIGLLKIRRALLQACQSRSTSIIPHSFFDLSAPQGPPREGIRTAILP